MRNKRRESNSTSCRVELWKHKPLLSCAQPPSHHTLTTIILVTVLLSANTQFEKREGGGEKTIKIENLKLQEKYILTFILCFKQCRWGQKNDLFKNLLDDNLWQPVVKAKLWPTLFIPCSWDSYVEKESSKPVVILWAHLRVIPLWSENCENILTKQLNLWLMKNVKNEKIVPVLTLKLFLSKSKLYLKKSSKTRKMKNCIYVFQFNTWSKYLLKSHVVIPWKQKLARARKTTKPVLKPCLWKWIVSCKAEEILWDLDNCLRCLSCTLALCYWFCDVNSVVQEFKFCLMIFHDGKTKVCWPNIEENHIWFFPATKKLANWKNIFVNFHPEYCT